MILPPQQQRVYNLLFTEMSYKLISFELNISVSTVETYSNIIFEKYGVPNRYSLILKVLGDKVKTLEEQLNLKEIKTWRWRGGVLPSIDGCDVCR